MSEQVDVISVVNLLRTIGEKKDNGFDLLNLCNYGLLIDIVEDYCLLNNKYNIINDVCRFVEIFRKIEKNDFSINSDDIAFLKRHIPQTIHENSKFCFNLASEEIAKFLEQYEMKIAGHYTKGILRVYNGGKK